MRMVRSVGVLEDIGIGDGAARGRHEVKGFVGTQRRAAIFAESAQSGLADQGGEIRLG